MDFAVLVAICVLGAVPPLAVVTEVQAAAHHRHHHRLLPAAPRTVGRLMVGAMVVVVADLALRVAHRWAVAAARQDLM